MDKSQAGGKPALRGVRAPARAAESAERVGCAGGRGKLGEARVVERSDSQAIDNMRVDRRTPLYAAPPHARSLQLGGEAHLFAWSTS